MYQLTVNFHTLRFYFRHAMFFRGCGLRLARLMIGASAGGFGYKLVWASADMIVGRPPARRGIFYVRLGLFLNVLGPRTNGNELHRKKKGRNSVLTSLAFPGLMITT